MASPGTPIGGPGQTQKEGISSKFAHWMALYAAYLFLAGWSYLKSFFHVFGIDTRWLDFGLNDTIAQGFTVLFSTGVWLSVVYLVIFLISLILEVLSTQRPRWLNTVAVVCLVLLFPATYWIASRAGIDRANTDRSDQTSLPTIVFTSGKCDYRGKLVYVKGDLFYVAKLVYANKPADGVSCTPDLSGGPARVPSIWVLKTADLSDINIVYYK